MKILAITLSLAAVFICYAAASPNGEPTDSGAGSVSLCFNCSCSDLNVIMYKVHD